MPQLARLRSVLEEARALLAAADNDFTWSSWQDRDDALGEIDALLADVRSGTLPSTLALHVLFAPTGPIQEVSLSSGWGDAFIELADRFDAAMASEQLDVSENQQPEPREVCTCFAAPSTHLIAVKELGLDSHLAEVSALICQECGHTGSGISMRSRRLVVRAGGILARSRRSSSQRSALSRRRRYWEVSAGITLVGAIIRDKLAGHQEPSR